MDKNQTLPSWIEADLEQAREMVERFLPETPEIQGLDCCGKSNQLLSVGGDYYDFITRQDKQFVFVIGDVSGKGVSAAFMMANLRYSLHSEIAQAKIDLVGVMNKLNSLVFASSPDNRFITFFYALYDPKNSRLRYVNAGHNPPILFRRRSSEPEYLEGEGLPIGLISEIQPPFPQYNQNTINLEPGDILVAFTDGVTEAINKNDEEWETENLIEQLKKIRNLSSSEIIEKIFEKINLFVGETPQRDDMTLVVIKAL